MAILKPFEENAEEPCLVAQDLEKSYPAAEKPAIDDLSLSVHAGEIFGLLGPNGAGKTTAISVMTGLLRPDAGAVHICGIDLFKRSKAARKLFGLVPQEIALYPNLTARENLRYFGRLYGLKGKQLKERVAESLSIVGLSDRAHQRIRTFSGGMKRRANLSAGLLHSPRLLFLDEPTVGIDAQSRNMILERLLEMREKGVAMIYTTHYMEEAQTLCSRIAVMDQGRIVAHGSPADLLRGYPECRDLGALFLHLTGKRLRD